MPSLESILYVEDDPDIRALAVLALETMGGFVLRAHGSGIDALATLEEGFRPDLLLFDVMMPDMDGPELLGRCRAALGNDAFPVVFITAATQPDEVKALMDLGALDVVIKPFQPMALPDRLRAVWAG